jgi:threonine synthase
MPLEVRYQHDRETHVSVTSEESLWRYHVLLPPVTPAERITKGEGWTPLEKIPTATGPLYIKNETLNPTGSFKDRGMSLALTMAKVQGVHCVCLPSAGNAGIAAAAYAQKGGLECHVFLPESIPKEFLIQTKQYGAETYLYGNNIAEAAGKMKEIRQKDWFDLSTLKEPFRIEGKKTLGYEIVEQLGWKFPDVIVYPTGGGTGLIGMWKAFQELKSLGWVRGKPPRMVAAQSEGCAPVVRAFKLKKDTTRQWKHNETVALGLNVPGPLGGSWILNTLQASGGMAVAVKENEIRNAIQHFNQIAHVHASEEAGVAWLAYQSLLDEQWISEQETVVLVATGIRRVPDNPEG